MKLSNKVIITNNTRTPFVLRGVDKTKNDKGIIVSKRTFSVTIPPKGGKAVDSELWDSLYNSKGSRVYRALVEMKKLVVTKKASDAGDVKGDKSITDNSDNKKQFKTETEALKAGKKDRVKLQSREVITTQVDLS